MLDPVLAPSGLSFDRASVLACLKAKPGECPVSRAPLRAADLYPNRALKTAIDEFLLANPWAHPSAGNS
jgi:hypothetical protein